MNSEDSGTPIKQGNDPWNLVYYLVRALLSKQWVASTIFPNSLKRKTKQNKQTEISKALYSKLWIYYTTSFLSCISPRRIYKPTYVKGSKDWRHQDNNENGLVTKVGLLLENYSHHVSSWITCGQELILKTLPWTEEEDASPIGHWDPFSVSWSPAFHFQVQGSW